MPEDADRPANDPGPNSRRVTGLDEKVRRPAASDNKRRARDSNPQPLAGHHISSVAASHSLTLRAIGFLSYLNRFDLERSTSIPPRPPRVDEGSFQRLFCLHVANHWHR